MVSTAPFKEPPGHLVILGCLWCPMQTAPPALVPTTRGSKLWLLWAVPSLISAQSPQPFHVSHPLPSMGATNNVSMPFGCKAPSPHDEHHLEPPWNGPCAGDFLALG